MSGHTHTHTHTHTHIHTHIHTRQLLYITHLCAGLITGFAQMVNTRVPIFIEICVPGIPIFTVEMGIPL